MAGGIILAAFVFATFSFYFYQVFSTPNLQVQKQERYLLIPTGATYQTVLDSLTQHKIVHDGLSFSFLAKLLGYQEAVKPGRYLIRPNMSNYALIRTLRAGRQTPVKLTFSPTRLLKDLPAKLCRQLEADSVEFARLVTDPKTVARYGFDTTTVMCMFIPDTYEIYWNTSAPELLERIHREYKAFWNPERTRKADAIGFTPIQVSVMASIVEAEQNKKNDEKPRIAGLYVNRMNARETNGRLQADPTVIFALRDFSIRRVLYVHTTVDSPYNTYRRKGLPPGPINSPPPSALDAVLNYEKHDYLYMCAKADFSGYHAFANNYEEHKVNAALFQAALNARNIMR